MYGYRICPMTYPNIANIQKGVISSLKSKTDKTMIKRNKMIYKTLHRKLKIEQHEDH